MKLSRKELIRKAAIKVMADLGYHNSTTDRIAEECGIAVGTIYNYFRNKEDILEYIFTVELEKRKSFYDEILNRDIPVLKKIEYLLDKHFAEISKDVAIGKVLVREQLISRKNNTDGVSEFLQGVPTLIKNLLDLGINNQEIRNCDTKLIASAIFWSVQGAVVNALNEEDEEKSVEILTNSSKELCHFFTRGLKD